jgi:hypothetical protein
MTRSLPYSRNQWLIPFAVQLIPAGIVLIGSLVFLRESPRWLWTRSRRKKAVATQCWPRKLQQYNTYILEEIKIMDGQIQSLLSAILKPIRRGFTSSKALWQLSVGHMLFVLQNFSGINTIVGRPFPLFCPLFTPSEVPLPHHLRDYGRPPSKQWTS